MRPLRLTMTAFGPYAGTETVDFDALTELGLFVVAGNNGAGKTTIFDALHYSLFGTLPGRRATYIRLKSDHADDRAECKVTLDFTAHGKQWRVERAPKQKRAKRRGTGSTEVDTRATLYELEHGLAGPATARANKIGEVNQQCRELVGLSGKQFERVALLPQGEFSRVLRESSTERRELLRTLFSSEIFGDATSLLTEQAAEATAADRSVLERLDHQQATLAESLSELVGQPVANVVSDLQVAIADYRRVQLRKQATAAQGLEHTANQASQKHQSAVEVCERMRRRSLVQREHQAHQQAEPQHKVDLARLGNARAAVPVASHLRAVAQQESGLAHANERVTSLHQKLNRALTVAGTPAIDSAIDPTSGQALSEPALAEAAARVAELSAQLNQRHQAERQASDLRAETNRFQGELRRITNEIANLDEHMTVAQAKKRSVTAELAELETAANVDECEQNLRTVAAQLHQRSELETLETEHQTLVRRASDLEAGIAQLEIAHEQASQAQASLPALQEKANDALDALEACSRRSEAAVAYGAANTRLIQARHEHRQAQSTAEQLWDAFIAGTAARVAQALVDDEPCPVCGSAEHPEPASLPTNDQAVTQADVAQARVRVDALQIDVRRVEDEIEHLRTSFPDIASLATTEANAQVATAKAMALGARTVADEARTSASRLRNLTTELDGARGALRDIDTEFRSVDERANHLRGALGELVHTSLAELQAKVDAASHARAVAERRVAKGSELATALAGADKDIETIGLGQIAAKTRLSARTAQCDERTNALEAATALLHELDHALLVPADVVETTQAFEQRSQAARHATETIGELTAALARQSEAATGLRRAQSILDDRLEQSPFASADAAAAAFVDHAIVQQLEAQTAAYATTADRLHGQLKELAGLPEIEPDVTTLAAHAAQATQLFADSNRELITSTTMIDRFDADLTAIMTERTTRQASDVATRRLERVAALVKGDNDRNTSLENWVLAAHLRDVVELANIRLARSTHQRFQLCVLDDGENKRGKWGLDLGVEDTVTGTRRPTAGLSGGELFQASLALALGLADAVMNQTAGVRIDALFIDEGFGSLDEVSVERAIDLLDELRDRGAMVGVITHVPALLDALPLGVRVVEAANGQGSTIEQDRLAA